MNHQILEKFESLINKAMSAAAFAQVDDPDNAIRCLENMQKDIFSLIEEYQNSTVDMANLEKLYQEFKRGVSEDGGKWPEYTGPGT